MRLTEDWNFTLHPGSRNLSLYKQVSPENVEEGRYGNLTIKGSYRSESERDKKKVQASLPSGSILMIDRVYVRQGKSEYSSITFQLKKTSRDDIDVEDAKGKKFVRFWVKLDDANKVRFEEVDTDDYQEPEIEWPSKVLTKRPYRSKGVVKVGGQPKFRVEYREKEIEKKRIERVLTSITDEYEDIDNFIEENEEELVEDLEKLNDVVKRSISGSQFGNLSHMGLGGMNQYQPPEDYVKYDRSVKNSYLKNLLSLAITLGGANSGAFGGMFGYNSLEDLDGDFNIIDKVQEFFKIERKSVPVETYEKVWDLYDYESGEPIYEGYTRHDSLKSRVKKELDK